ncbi:MAG: hypothetical protein KY442_00340 [Proteobacteria bacterium]|nr:hypothetical protein [Pseudomonadota bacterium]
MTGRLDPYRLTVAAAPLAVWALHLVVVYGLVGLGCAQDWHLRRIAGLELLTWTLLLATAAALGAIAWLGWWSWEGWRRVSGRSPCAGEAAETLQRRQRFLGLATLLSALLGFIAVVFTATPIFMLPSCT